MNATFTKKFREINYWVARNKKAIVHCENIKDARSIVKRSGINQTIEIK